MTDAPKNPVGKDALRKLEPRVRRAADRGDGPAELDLGSLKTVEHQEEIAARLGLSARSP